MSEHKKLAISSVVQIGGKVLAVVFGVYTVAIFTRHLGEAGYGQLSTVLSYLSVFAIIVDFGLTLTTTQMISEKEADEKSLIGNLVTLRVVSASIFLALAPLIAIAAPFLPYDNTMIVAIAIGAISYLFGSTSQLFVGVFQKRLLMGRVAFAEMINRLAVFLGAILAPILGFGIVEIIWLMTIGNAFQLILNIIFARQLLKFSLEWNISTWIEVIKRSWPIGASIFFNLIYLRGDMIFLSIYRSFEEIGQYAAAYKIMDVVTVVPVMFMGLILPKLVHDWKEGNKDAFNNRLQTTFNLFSLIALPFAFGAIVTGVPLMVLISGDNFAEAGRVLAILGPAAAIVFYGALSGHAIVGLQKQKVMTWGYLLVAIITVAGYMYFIPTYGIWAAAWWTLIAEILIFLLTAAVVIKITNFKPNFTSTAKALAASIIMTIALYTLPNMHVIFTITIGTIIYTICLLLFQEPTLKKASMLFLPENPPIK